MIIPGCTYVLDVDLDDTSVDLHDASDINVRINQNGEILDFGNDRINIGVLGYTFEIFMTQAETLRFRRGPATVQVNWIYIDPILGVSRAATTQFVIEFDQQLLRKVVE